MKCRQAHALIVRSQDAPLGTWKRVALRTHLMMCDACTAFSRQIDFIRKACRAFPGDGKKE